MSLFLVSQAAVKLMKIQIHSGGVGCWWWQAPRRFRMETESKKQGLLKRTTHNPETTLPCVADLLCTAFLEVEEKCWCLYLLRRSAVALEPYANLPAVEFGPRLPGQVARGPDRYIYGRQLAGITHRLPTDFENVLLEKVFDLGRTVSRYKHSLKGDHRVGIMERMERMDRIIVVQHLRGLCDVHRTSHRL